MKVPPLLGINPVNILGNIFLSFWPFILCCNMCAWFFFNLTLSHEHFFISLNIYGRHHSKLFTSPSDRTSHSACNAPAQGCSGRQFCDPGLWRFRNSSLWWWSLVMKSPESVWTLGNCCLLRSIPHLGGMPLCLIFFLTISIAVPEVLLNLPS